LALSTGDRAIPTSDGTLPATQAYLLEANIASLDADLIAFLEGTAVFETLSTRVLERDAAFASALQCLQRLEARGVMLSVVRPGVLYRIHPLLREALLERVRLRAGTAALALSHLHAAGLLEEAGNITAALFHLEAGGDVDALLRFLHIHAYDAFIAGNGERVTRLARGLRARGVESPALFERLEGMLARQRGEAGAETHFAESLHAAKRSGDAASELAARFLLTEDRLARRDATSASELAMLLILAKAHGPLLESDALLFDGWRCAIERDFSGARTRARTASALAGDDLVRQIRAVSLEAYSALCLGDIAGADGVLGGALHQLEGSDHIVLLANTLVWYARFALLWGDVAAARDYAEQGEALARRLQLPAELAGVYLALAEIAAYSGDREACASAGEAARSFAASAWYAMDRVRVPALTALYLARATFAERGARPALEVLDAELSRGDAPAVCRAALEADGAAYARVAGLSAANERSRRAAESIDAAPVDDALDAVTLATARAVLAAAAGATADRSPSTDPERGFERLLAYRANLPGLDEANGLLRALIPNRAAARSAGTQPHGTQLTKREREILELMTHGLTNKEIAQRFTLSPRTVDTHVERVLAKLNVGSRTRAVAAALRSGLVASP
jgi:ATP/maltotriose-dependent transcriptional regulator MalT